MRQLRPAGTAQGQGNLRLRERRSTKRLCPTGAPGVSRGGTCGAGSPPTPQSLWGQPHGRGCCWCPSCTGGRRLAAPPIPTRCQVCACHDCEFQVCLSRASVIFKLSFGVQEIKRWKKLQSDKAPMGSKMSQIKRGGNYMDLFTPFLVGKKGERFRRPHNSG